MIVALKLEANWQEKENFIEVFYEGNNEKQRDKDVGSFMKATMKNNGIKTLAVLRQIIEVDNHRNLVSVKFF